MTWVHSGNVSNVSVLEGTFEFNVVVPNAISSFEAWGTKPSQTQGYGTNFQFSDSNPYASPARVDPSSLPFAVHGAARVYGRQVLVGESPVGVPGVPRGKLQVLDSNGTNAWHYPAPFNLGPAPYPLRSAATYGRDGFMAVGEHGQVFVTQAADSGFVTAGMNVDAWQAVDLHTVCDDANHCLLGPEEYPNFYGVTRIGDANVIVGDDLTILVFRAQPPQWVARNGEVWEPWSRIRLAPRVAMGGDDPTPILRAVAPDEVQEIVRPDARYAATGNVFPPIVDSEGWVLTVGDNGAAYRLRLHLAEAKVGLGSAPFYDTAPDDNDPDLPGPALQPLTFTGGGTLPAETYDVDADGYYDGNFYGVTSDEQSRVIVGSGNRVFTAPKYAPFDDRMLLDRNPTPPNGVAAADIVWRGVASDEVTWFLVGRGRLSTGASIGAYWYGRPEVTTCRAEYDPDCEPQFLLDRCFDPNTATLSLPSSHPADYRIGPARVALNDAGELEVGTDADTVQVSDTDAVRVPPDPTPDPDVHLQVWKINLEHTATGQQVEALLVPSLTQLDGVCPADAVFQPPFPTLANPGFWAYAKSIADVGFNRGFTTFRMPSQAPAVLTGGHIREAIQVDVFTGLGVGGAGVSQVSLDSVLNPELIEPVPAGVCGAVRDQVNSGLPNGLELAVLPASLNDLIAGFSRFRSGDGHGFVDNYEATRQGKQQRYQSMKHYVYGRCRSSDCNADPEVWEQACCVAAAPGVLTGKREFVDLYAPFEALMFQLPNPDQLNMENPDHLDWPVPPTAPLQGNESEWWTYPAGGSSGGRSCSLFDGNTTAGDISHDQGRTVLLLNDNSVNKYRVAVVFDHAETCLTLPSDVPLAVQKGRRIARFMTHGETEVQLWVNDRVGRWRLMSYFDELPEELYQYYVDAFDFSPRGTYDDRTPFVSLEHRDQCPLLPEPSDGILGKEMPDHPGLYRVCDTYGGYTMPAACPTAGCPSDNIMIPAATCATPNFVHTRVPTPQGAPPSPGNAWFERHPTDASWFPFPL